MKMKHIRTIALIAVILIPLTLLAYTQFATAQATQASYTLNLTYLTVQVTYPAQVMPGDSITVSLQATAKKSIDTLSLTGQAYYSDGSSLHQLASTTFNVNNMATGSSFTKQIQFTVPQDTPRTSLVAVLTESVKQTSYAAYYYYPVYYNYSSPYCYFDPYWGYSHCDSYYDYYGYMAYPSYSSSTSTDSGLSPLSYVKATTPEFAAAQSQNQALQQQLSQSQAQNQQLQQQLQNAQNSNSQKDATISDLNQRLNASQSSNTTYESATVILAILAVVLGAFAILRGRTTQTTQTAQTKTKSETQSKQ